MPLGSIFRALHARYWLSGVLYPIGPAGPVVPLYPDIPGEAPAPGVPLDPEARRHLARDRAAWCDRPGCIRDGMCQRMTGPAQCASEIPPELAAALSLEGIVTDGPGTLEHGRAGPPRPLAERNPDCQRGVCVMTDRCVYEACGLSRHDLPGDWVTGPRATFGRGGPPSHDPDTSLCLHSTCQQRGHCEHGRMNCPAPRRAFPCATFGRRKAPPAPAPVTFPDTVPTSHVMRLCSPDDMALLDAAAAIRANAGQPVVVDWNCID